MSHASIIKNVTVLPKAAAGHKYLVLVNVAVWQHPT